MGEDGSNGQAASEAVQPAPKRPEIAAAMAALEAAEKERMGEFQAKLAALLYEYDLDLVVAPPQVVIVPRRRT